MPIQLVISVDDNGRISVNGPIKDMVQAYGLLELAKDVIRDFQQQQARRVQPADATDLAKLTQ